MATSLTAVLGGIYMQNGITSLPASTPGHEGITSLIAFGVVHRWFHGHDTTGMGHEAVVYGQAVARGGVHRDALQNYLHLPWSDASRYEATCTGCKTLGWEFLIAVELTVSAAIFG